MQPSLFLSHAVPPVLLGDPGVQAFFADWRNGRPRPSAVIAVTAHWETKAPTVGVPVVKAGTTGRGAVEWGRAASTGARLQAGAALADRVHATLSHAGLDPDRELVDSQSVDLEHSVWLPLTLLLGPEPVPVVVLSVQPQRGCAAHLILGQALAPFRDEDVLILGSGSLTHNHQEVDASLAPGEAKPWVSAFCDWMVQTLAAGDVEALIAYRQNAPFAALAHPREDHLAPLWVACGASASHRGTLVHDGVCFGAVSLAAFCFDQAPGAVP